MLNHVDIEAGTKRLHARFSRGPLHDLSNFEIDSIRMFAMEKRGGDPDLVGHLDLHSGCACHIDLQQNIILVAVLITIYLLLE